MSKAVKEALADIEIDGGDKGPQVDEWWGEPDLRPAERVYAANTFNILTYWCGTPGRPVNAIPPKAVANCQLRFVAGTRVADIVPAVERHLRAKGHHLVKVLPPPSSQRRPFHGHAHGARPSLGAAGEGLPAALLQRQAGHHTRPCGGSICNDIFTDDLGMPTVWIPALLRLLLPALAGRAHPDAADRGARWR